MADIRRRVLEVRKRVVKDSRGTPRWRILHKSYSDGGEVYEVHSLETGQFRRFATRSEMDSWLRKAMRTRAP